MSLQARIAAPLEIDNRLRLTQPHSTRTLNNLMRVSLVCLLTRELVDFTMKLLCCPRYLIVHKPLCLPREVRYLDTPFELAEQPLDVIQLPHSHSGIITPETHT